MADEATISELHGSARATAHSLPSSVCEDHTDNSRFDLLTVSSVAWKAHFKRLTLQPIGQYLTVPLSASVSKGDQVRVTEDAAWVFCKNGEAQIHPSYVACESVKLGGLHLDLVLKEITEADELAAYWSLTDYHYRGHRLCGRTARLIVRNFHPFYPRVIGYIELATPLYMNKARSAILDAPFRDGAISWDRWDMATMRRYIHLIVRVARCVILPEFRGLGLGQLLLRHAAEFARSR